MKVMYKASRIYGPDLTDFPYKECDYVTIVVRYWTSKEVDGKYSRILLCLTPKYRKRIGNHVLT
ncbi:hypothetical protein QNH20_12555 [Neobacillus sp. WH10]|uniref:hypothetical protein n=1 Tax=Neobacillus sp. WH10 TaxID=3047873 RepID=UPI0024C0F5B6|nr:hypothetical protein [Neobacillus sp. WH10]WHY79917.1 hypothetical protein QNH20_12555 [Neobacillus sp. WH10]